MERSGSRIDSQAVDARSGQLERCQMADGELFKCAQIIVGNPTTRGESFSELVYLLP